MKILKFVTLAILLFPAITFSATNDFVAGSNITVSDVSFGASTANMLIINGSTAESWTFDGGAFTVTNPGTFKVGSSDSSVKSIQVSQSGSVSVCAENTTPGTSYATVPTSSGTYTVQPSSTTDCTNLCTTLANTATYNSYSTCGAATCNSGYRLSGSGASATCVPIGGGGIFTGTLPIPAELTPRLQTVYPDGTVVYHDESQIDADTTEEQRDTETKILTTYTFTKPLYKTLQNQEVTNLQQILRELGFFTYPTNTGYYGTITETAVKQFQCDNDIICEGSPETTGYGIVGPKTRKVLNKEMEKQKNIETKTEEQQKVQIEEQINDLMKLVEELQKQLIFIKSQLNS